MKQLEIYHSQTRRRIPGGGMIDPSIGRTGASQYAQKAADDMSRAADAVSENLFKIAQAESYSQLSTATRKREEDYNETMLKIEQEADFTKHQKHFSDFQTRAKALGDGLPGMAQRQWKQDMDERMPAYENRFNNLDYDKRRRAVVQDNTANWERAIQDRDEITLRRVAQANVAGNIWSQEYADNEIAKAGRQIAVSHVQDVLSSKIVNGDLSVKQAMDLLGKEEFVIDTKEGKRKSYQIDSETRSKMAREILFWGSQRKQAVAEEQKAAYDEGDKEAFLAFTSNTLSNSQIDDMVRKNRLTTSDAWHYRQALKSEEEKAIEMQKIAAEASAEAAKTDLGQKLYADLSAGTLTEDVVTKLVSQDKALTAEDGDKWKGWIRQQKKVGPAKTDPAVLWDMKEQIHRVKMGQGQAESVKSRLRSAAMSDKTLSVQDAESLQNDLNNAIESASKNDNPQSDNLKSAGMQLLGRAFNEGIYGKKDAPEAAMLYGQRMGQWEKYWQSNPKATPADAQAFLDLLVAANVKHKMRDILPFISAQGRREKYEARINEELGRFAAQKAANSFVLGDTDDYEIGQTIEKDGVVYTYKGNGKWEY